MVDKLYQIENKKCFNTLCNKVKAWAKPFIEYDCKNNYKHLLKISKNKRRGVTTAWDSGDVSFEIFDVDKYFDLLHYYFDNEKLTSKEEYVKDFFRDKIFGKNIQKVFCENILTKFGADFFEDFYGGYQAELNKIEIVYLEPDYILLLTGINELNFFLKLVKSGKINIAQFIIDNNK
jgi:hypothetical protein